MTSVSVIMPMRDAQRFVRDAILSVLAEAYVPLEVVVVDDGSTDGSREEVEKLGDSRVRVIEGPARGISACMNTGLASAKGDVVMFCDADDLFPPGRIREQVTWLAEHPDFGAVSGSFSTIDRQGRLIARLCGPDTSAFESIESELASGVTRTSLCTYAVRRSVVDCAGGFREYFETAQDIDFQLRLGSVCRVAFIHRNAYFYRLHAASITHTQRAVRREHFEQTAREFQRQRLADGADALTLGRPPPPPTGVDSGPSSVSSQIQGMQVGQSWRSLKANDRHAAIRHAWLAIVTAPLKVSTWLNLLKILACCLYPWRDGESQRKG